MDPFVTPADLEAFLGETLDDSGGSITLACESACQTIRDYLEQTINLVRGDIETHNGHQKEALLLRQLPVIEVSDVTEDEVALTVDDDYIVDERLGTLWRKSSTFPLGWSFGKQNILVTYDHGWAITDDDVVEPNSAGDPVVERVPADIRTVALALAARVLRAGAVPVSAAGLTSETIGDYSYTRDVVAAGEDTSLALSDLETAALSRYKPGNL